MVLVPYLEDEAIKILELSIQKDNNLKLNTINETGLLFKNCKKSNIDSLFYCLFNLDIEFQLAADDQILNQEYLEFMRQLQFKMLDDQIDAKEFSKYIDITSQNISSLKYVESLIA